MSAFNKVILLGNLTRDVELKYSSAGKPVAHFGLATNRKWTNKDTGEKNEETCFVDLTAFGRTAEIASEYLKKGSLALIEGRLSFYAWTDEASQQKRSKLSVTVEGLQLMPRNGSRPPAAEPEGETAQDQVDAGAGEGEENGGKVPF